MLRLALHWQILITMVVGLLVGIGLNQTVGESTTEAEHESDKLPAWIISDSADRVDIQVFKKDAQGFPTKELEKRIVVDASLEVSEIKKLTDQGIVHFRSIKEFTGLDKTKDLYKNNKDAFKIFQEHGRSTARICGDVAKSIGDLFLRMLKMVAIPLIVTSLISGVTGLGQTERLGKMFGRTLLYYMATSVLAIIVGLTLVNVIQPGIRNADAEKHEIAKDEKEQKNLGTVMFEQLENVIPENPAKALAEGNFLSIISFSLMIGVFTILVGGKTAELVGDLAQAGFDIMMAMTMAVIRLAPIGVLFMMLSATASQGLAVFPLLGMYMLTVACALSFHAVVTLPLILKYVARRNPLEFARAMSPALLTAFSSASSNGTLPLTLTSVEQRAGVSNRISSFVLPLGATINMDGTALYEVVAVLFIAQLSGIELTLAQQIIVAVTALIASIGAAGIPHAGLIMMVIILQAVGLPTEAQGMIIAVDRVLDMCRTSVNVWSDSCGCAVIARYESTGEKTA